MNRRWFGEESERGGAMDAWGQKAARCQRRTRTRMTYLVPELVWLVIRTNSARTSDVSMGNGYVSRGATAFLHCNELEKA